MILKEQFSTAKKDSKIYDKYTPETSFNIGINIEKDDKEYLESNLKHKGFDLRLNLNSLKKNCTNGDMDEGDIVEDINGNIVEFDTLNSNCQYLNEEELIKKSSISRIPKLSDRKNRNQEEEDSANNL